MSNTQPPAQFDWATELSDAQGQVTLSEQEAHEIGARLRASHGQAPAGESLRTLKSTTAQAAPGAVAGPSEAELLALVRTFLEREDECRERENDEEDRFTDLERTQYRILRSTAVQALRAALAAAPTTQPAPQQEPVEMPAAIEQMATGRYKVVPSHESMFHRWAVVAGTGAQQLYLGREVECQNMARKFAGAFLDGVYVALRNAAPPALARSAGGCARGLRYSRSVPILRA